MDSRENNITSSQLMGLIVTLQIGPGILSLPNSLAIDCGHDGWIFILIYGLIITAVISIIIRLMNRYNNKSIYKINMLLYGKYLGGLLNLLIVIYIWYAACLCLNGYTNVIHTTLLRTTPSLAICIFILIPIYYLTWYGLKYVVRFASMIYLTLSFCCLMFLLVFRELKLSFLMPIGQSGIEGIKSSFHSCVFALLGYEDRKSVV